jgi:hypothetical protein
MAVIQPDVSCRQKEMRRCSVIAFVMLFSVMAAAQSTSETEAPSKPNFQVDCSKFDASPACGSYNEMIEKGDGDLLSSINGMYHSVVCFRPGEDVFMVLYFVLPDSLAYRSVSTSKYVLATDGYIGYARYKDGIFDDGDVAQGEWTKTKYTSSVFHSARGTQPSAHVDDNEINYASSFKNLEKTTTDYTFSVRLSTLRFVETYQAPGHKPSDPIHEFTQSGHCAEFK